MKVNIRILLLTIILFGIEFSVPIMGIISLRKLVFIAILILLVTNHQKKGVSLSSRRLVILSLFIIILMMYAFSVVYLISKVGRYTSKGVYQVANLISLWIYMVLFPVLLIPLYKSALEFARCQWYITIFQSVIVLIGMIFRPFRIYIFYRFAYGDGRLLEGIENGIRSVGIDLSGSAGSMVLFSGLLCGGYLFLYSNIKDKKIILFETTFVLGAFLFMGRTGLYFGIIGILIICIDCIYKKDPIVNRIFGILFFICMVVIAYIILAPDTWGLRTWVKWITEFKNLFDEGSAISVIRSMNIPPLTRETFFGTGMLYGVTQSGLILNHDAGYVRMYTAIGLLGCVVYYNIIYMYFLSMICKIKSHSIKKLYIFFLLVIMICEIKEPFLSKTPIGIILSSMLLLEMRCKKQKILIRGIDI